MDESPTDIVLALETFVPARPYAKDVVAAAVAIEPERARDFSWLMVGVGWRETRLRNVLGDHGHGWGVWQIDDRAHSALCMLRMPDGSPQVMDPPTCARMAAGILSGCLASFPDDVEAALCAYNAGASAVRRHLEHGGDPNTATTGGDYGRWILARLVEWGVQIQWGAR